ncbi:thiamine pyrophosphate-requiring protein [Bowmanella dokdonensis]|uniref:Thiamine pyrophosphate-requiring protein n=1 Tax=Bowmanella dokdonensis TaxID=751969 RepID=A0A939DJL1_9ALTE|nr:thiamine pyrophosphate-requiring protein [Bowmanella dokdonensis]MBN7823908.1 thiamine pyrophosphate-requiring protein [Bowmanella dokdonensis]
MSKSVADFLVERLTKWGVNRVFGYPGEGINGILGALDKHQDSIRFIQARHEEMAAFMACAHAKFTSQASVCVATSGGGAVHLLNGLYDAAKDHQPVVAIVGQQSRNALGGTYQQEIDLPALFKDVAAYVQMVVAPAQMRHVIDRAMRIAQAERTVTCVVIPLDVQSMEAVETPPREHGTVHSGAGYQPPRTVPAAADLQRAADILNQGERVAMLVGAGALGAGDEVLQTANLLGAGIAKALLGKTVVADDEPNVTGAIGLLGTKPSWQLMKECDTLLMVGSGFPYSEFLPEEGQARGVQIDIEPRMLNLRYPMEASLVGDSKATLRELIPLLEHKEERAWQEQIKENVRDWWKILKARAMKSANPINPQRVFWELSSRLPDNCIITTDAGSAANWYARDLKVRPTMMASLSGGLASMGSGVPYAIAAKFAHPERPVIALVGDGAMQMNGNAELVTVQKYWQSWQDPHFVVLVLNNRDLNQVTWEQRVLAGDPRFKDSQALPDFPYADYAKLLGFEGILVDDPEKLGSAWDQALNARRPVLIEARTDADVPPLPPHLTLEQVKAYLSALLKGDPDAAGVIASSIKQASGNWLGKNT